jgi:hypothetical protein
MINLLISKELGLNTLKEIMSFTENNLINVLSIEDHGDKRSKLNEIRKVCLDKKIFFRFHPQKMKHINS